MGSIQIKEVAGYLTEKAVWQIIKEQASMQQSDVWHVGATAFYALMGVEVFGGNGPSMQNEDTPVPRIGEAHCSRRLSNIIHSCLAFHSEDRPSLQELITIANDALSTKEEPPKRLYSSTGKSYNTSLLKFWPEEMNPVVVMLLLLVLPFVTVAQSKMMITQEMSALVKNVSDMRNPQNMSHVERALYNDRQWTLMDEIKIDSNGECTVKDKVNTFGLNQMGYRIARYNRGVSNTGGRFRNGQDPRYNYSFIEVTAKRGATLKYEITGREGGQVFAVVPYDPKSAFAVSMTRNSLQIGEKQEEDGVQYIVVNENIKKSDVLTLRIVNSSPRNLSYVIINYNSRQAVK